MEQVDGNGIDGGYDGVAEAADDTAGFVIAGGGCAGVSLMDGSGGGDAAGGMDERVGGVDRVAGGQVDGNPVQATLAAVAVVGKSHGIIR